MKLSFLLVFLFSATAAATLYGNDSRQLVRRGSLASSSASRAIGVMVANNAILDSKQGADFKDIDTAPLSANQYMCSSERFSDLQSFAVSCTGFLIAPDLLVTAGHCAVNFGEVTATANPYCTDFSWYFDFEADMSGKVITEKIPAANFYQCEKVIKAAHTSIPVSDREIIFKDDFAIIKLKKPVTGRTPLKLTSARPAPSSSISMIGHPLGAPKTSVSGRLLTNESTYDRAAVSGFEGNSGSPVFNSRGEVFGILVRGYPPGLIDSKTDRTCSVVNRCSADAKTCAESDPNGQPAGDHIMPLSLIPELKELRLLK